jgi:ATP-dependent DNA helicase RecG
LAAIFEEIRHLGAKPRREVVREIILRLCRVRPMGAEEIAASLGRTRPYVSSFFLGPMVRDGELAYLYPEAPAHPLQKYATVEAG